MKTVREYTRHADECEALAKKATTPKERKIILEMAEAWRKLAETRKKALALKQLKLISN